MPVHDSLVLNVFVNPPGHHEAAWRHPATDTEGIYSLDYYTDLARRAEAAKFDAVFFADSPALWEGAEFTASGRLEPLVTLAAVAARTERIGLIATASTTFHDVYTLARLLNTLDHVSAGRAGWNIVTTASAAVAENYGDRPMPSPEERYARAEEFVTAIRRLWDSWEDDAIVADRATGRYLDPAKVRRADFGGHFVTTRGAFTAPRSPQGHPVLVQAGASSTGRDFAASHAEAIFTASSVLGDAVAFADDLRRRVAASAHPRAVRILPGIVPFIADTDAEARELVEEFDDLQVTEYGLRRARDLTGVELSEDDLDRPVPPELLRRGRGDFANFQSRLQVIAAIVERENPTLRQLLKRVAGGRGHHVVAGAPATVADSIAEWHDAGAADGFNVMPPWFPGGLDAFADRVVPILQERGLFRTEYTGTTLREHYGLPRPSGVHRPERSPVTL